jgi:circadian clock protein KaiB
MSEGDSIQLFLFVRGNAARSSDAIRVVRKTCDALHSGKPALHVIDVFQEPELVEKYHVVATPTLVTLTEGAERRLVGDVSEAQVRACLAAIGAGVHGV